MAVIIATGEGERSILVVAAAARRLNPGLLASHQVNKGSNVIYPPRRGRAARRERKLLLCLLIGVALVSGCKRVSQRDRDDELLTHFALRGAASHESLMVALRQEVLRHAPLGSRSAAVVAYLDSLGFPDAASGPTRRRTFSEPGAVVIEARLEHHPHHWYDIAPCNYTHEVQFALDADNRLEDVRIAESGSCM